MRIITLDQSTRENILSTLLKRDPNNYENYGTAVQEIVDKVKEKKDEAVFAYTRQFDGADIDSSTVRVRDEEIKEAMAAVSNTSSSDRDTGTRRSAPSRSPSSPARYSMVPVRAMGTFRQMRKPSSVSSWLGLSFVP